MTTRKSLNIILFGETGVGKSSLVNLIAGREVAPTSGDSDACTMTYRPYIFEVHGISYTIWDTRGCDEADTNMKARGYLAAVEQAYKLIRDLTAKGGVDLLVLCHREGRITTTTRSNYKLFSEALCESKVPIALVITFLERHARMEDWWEENVNVFENHGMRVAGHACVTGLLGHSKSLESKSAIEHLLGHHDGNGRYNMPAEQWFPQFLRRSAGLRGCPKDLNRSDLERFLRERCELNARDAHSVAGILVEGRDSDASPQGRRSLIHRLFGHRD